MPLLAPHHGGSPDTVFVSLGMFIIDEIHYVDKPSEYNVLGGGGLFGLLGSRIVLSFNDPARAGFILDAGKDFSDDTQTLIDRWETGTVIRHDELRLTTRGWNKYGERDFREFKYLTPKVRIDIEDIAQHENLIKSRSFHFICSADRCATMVRKLGAVKNSDMASDPVVICWEPIPDLCTVESLQECYEILKFIDIFTPNAEEAARYFGEPEPTDKKSLEELAGRFIPYLRKNTCGVGSGIVLRCGELGCYIRTTKSASGIWIPAFQTVNPKPKIVDCTGAGNTMCLSIATGLVLTGDWRLAGICGNVAAGLCIELKGMPELTGKSCWNGIELKQRFQKYLEWTGISVELNVLISKLESGYSAN